MTKATCGYGTIVELDGLRVSEVFSVRLCKEGIEIGAFYIPIDPTHKCILKKIQHTASCSLAIWFAGKQAILQCSGPISGEAGVKPSDAWKLRFLITGPIEVA